MTFTATVTGRSPTGTVTFSSGGALLGTSPVANGVATFNTSSLPIGAEAVTAAYGGDAANAASTLVALSERIDAAPTRTRLTSSMNPSVAGQPVRLTATVAPATAALAAPPGPARGSPASPRAS